MEAFFAMLLFDRLVAGGATRQTETREADSSAFGRSKAHHRIRAPRRAQPARSKPPAEARPNRPAVRFDVSARINAG